MIDPTPGTRYVFGECPAREAHLSPEKHAGTGSKRAASRVGLTQDFVSNRYGAGCAGSRMSGGRRIPGGSEAWPRESARGDRSGVDERANAGRSSSPTRPFLHGLAPDRMRIARDSVHLRYEP